MTDTRPPIRLSPTRLGLAVAAAAALLLVVGLWPAAPGQAAEQPSYARLLPLLQAGMGKQLDDGDIELYALGESIPRGWVWVVDDTRDGNGVEYWILHSTFPFPGPQNDNVTIEFDYRSDIPHQGVEDFVAWIVATYPHVAGPEELAIHLSTVTLQ